MARMIDADALKVAVRKKFKDLPSRCEINGLVNAAHTVDAIPVEWLKELLLPTGDDVDKVAFVRIMRKWLKEQEGQDSEAYRR